jgi:hypothetical protein
MTLLLAGLLIAGSASARTVIVRVDARDYQELYDHIPFKGTSIDIAGAQPGKTYDLVLDETDLALVQTSGLNSEVIVPDLDYWGELNGTDGQYRSYDEHVVLLRNWASLYATICKLESIGPTYENRWIYGLKISDDPQIQDPTEPEMLLYGQIHAREWATSEMIRYAIDTLLRNYMSNQGFRDWINSHQLWVFPLHNVDGYTYDYPGQLMWRKNRQPFGGSTGTDMNRNGNGSCQGNPQTEWGALVSGSRTSHRPSDETFMGPRGASAPGARALTELFKQHTFLVDISVHSYSELVLWPWGVNQTPPDGTFMTRLGQRMAGQISRISGGTYTPQQSVQLYPTNGGIEDWFYGWARTVGGFPCPSYTFEVGTSFYQSTSNLDQMQPQVFKGIWTGMQHVDSVKLQLKGMAPRPILAAMDTSPDGSFTIHWTPIRPEYNTPDRWELEELSDLSVITDDIEGNTSLWVLQGATQSTTQKHSGTKSFFLGNSSNMSNWVVTKDPYPVSSADDSVTFWVWHNLENNYDAGMCEVSLEGKEWTQLHDRYTGNSSGWVRKAYSLAPWLGRSVFIRFHAVSDDGTNSGGMYVDDIRPVPSFANRTVVNNNIADTLYAVTGHNGGRFWYRVRGHNAAWNWGDQGPLEDIFVAVSAVAEKPGAPQLTGINRVSPNPGSGPRDLSYTLGRTGPVRLSVYDPSGALVRTLVTGAGNVGFHSVTWDGRDGAGRKVSNGVYLLRLEADRTVETRIVTLN